MRPVTGSFGGSYRSPYASWDRSSFVWGSGDRSYGSRSKHFRTSGLFRPPTSQSIYAASVGKILENFQRSAAGMSASTDRMVAPIVAGLFGNGQSSTAQPQATNGGGNDMTFTPVSAAHTPRPNYNVPNYGNTGGTNGTGGTDKVDTNKPEPVTADDKKSAKKDIMAKGYGSAEADAIIKKLEAKGKDALENGKDVPDKKYHKIEDKKEREKAYKKWIKKFSDWYAQHIGKENTGKDLKRIAAYDRVDPEAGKPSKPGKKWKNLTIDSSTVELGYAVFPITNKLLKKKLGGVSKVYAQIKGDKVVALYRKGPPFKRATKIRGVWFEGDNRKLKLRIRRSKKKVTTPSKLDYAKLSFAGVEKIKVAGKMMPAMKFKVEDAKGVKSNELKNQFIYLVGKTKWFKKDGDKFAPLTPKEFIKDEMRLYFGLGKLKLKEDIKDGVSATDYLGRLDAAAKRITDGNKNWKGLRKRAIEFRHVKFKTAVKGAFPTVITDKDFAITYDPKKRSLKISCSKKLAHKALEEMEKNKAKLKSALAWLGKINDFNGESVYDVNPYARIKKFLEGVIGTTASSLSEVEKKFLAKAEEEYKSKYDVFSLSFVSAKGKAITSPFIKQLYIELQHAHKKYMTVVAQIKTNHPGESLEPKKYFAEAQKLLKKQKVKNNRKKRGKGLLKIRKKKRTRVHPIVLPKAPPVTATRIERDILVIGSHALKGPLSQNNFGAFHRETWLANIAEFLKDKIVQKLLSASSIERIDLKDIHFQVGSKKLLKRSEWNRVIQMLKKKGITIPVIDSKIGSKSYLSE
ncbi:MAG: hypothetical protein ABIE74_06925, partial [Pseudomonadota bacterium]